MHSNLSLNKELWKNKREHETVSILSWQDVYAKRSSDQLELVLLLTLAFEGEFELRHCKEQCKEITIRMSSVCLHGS
jgi:hypothetical protein